VLLRPRYHPVRFVPGALLLLLGAGAAVASYLLPGDSSTALLWVGGGLAVLGLGTIGIRALVDSFDEFAVTSVRVIKKTGFLTRHVVQIPVEKVQDLKLVATFWGRWLSYGDVMLESAGESAPLVFSRIRNPEQLRNVLFSRRAVEGLPAVAPVRRSVEERLKEADRLRQAGLLSEAEYEAKRRELIGEL